MRPRPKEVRPTPRPAGYTGGLSRPRSEAAARVTPAIGWPHESTRRRSSRAEARPGEPGRHLPPAPMPGLRLDGRTCHVYPWAGPLSPVPRLRPPVQVDRDRRVTRLGRARCGQARTSECVRSDCSSPPAPEAARNRTRARCCVRRRRMGSQTAEITVEPLIASARERAQSRTEQHSAQSMEGIARRNDQRSQCICGVSDTYDARFVGFCGGFLAARAECRKPEENKGNRRVLTKKLNDSAKN